VALSLYGGASKYGLRSELCRWLLVRVGFVWRLLAGEAVRGEGRWYMAGGHLQVQERGVWVMDEAEGRMRECRLSLRRKEASPHGSHHECNGDSSWVVTVRSVSQKTCPRGEVLISGYCSGNSHGGQGA
jgi:hypothetical protein